MQDYRVVQVWRDDIMAINVSVGELKYSLYGLPERDFVEPKAKQGDFRIPFCPHSFDQIANRREIA